MKKIKDVSKMAGVSIRTLQYYDNEGLTNLHRTKDNHRLYQKKDLELIWKILIYKEMDFQIVQIKELLTLPANKQITYIEKRKEDLNNQIANLVKKEQFIQWIEEEGMPDIPPLGLSISYKEYISKLKNKIVK